MATQRKKSYPQPTEDILAIGEAAAEARGVHPRDTGKFAVDAWKIHTGEFAKPAGWKDPYAGLETKKKATQKAASKKPATTKKKK